MGYILSTISRCLQKREAMFRQFQCLSAGIFYKEWWNVTLKHRECHVNSICNQFYLWDSSTKVTGWHQTSLISLMLLVQEMWAWSELEQFTQRRGLRQAKPGCGKKRQENQLQMDIGTLRTMENLDVSQANQQTSWGLSRSCSIAVSNGISPCQSPSGFPAWRPIP